MENSALNKAHQEHRKSVAHLRYRRFMEAIECHKNAAELLTEALKTTQNHRAVESINLQREFHIRQKDIILAKKGQYENYKKAIENRNCHLTQAYVSDYGLIDNQNSNLKSEIYRTMEETDSLLTLLIKRGNSAASDSESLKSFSLTDTDDKGSSDDTIDSSNCNVSGKKHPKDDFVVIEELRTLKDQLQSLVFRLVNQLDASTKEVDILKDKIKLLESEKNEKVQNKNATNNLKVATDSSGGTSPYVFSPCSDFCAEIQEHRTLPTLAPLEMPSFDFNSFIKNNPNCND